MGYLLPALSMFECSSDEMFYSTNASHIMDVMYSPVIPDRIYSGRARAFCEYCQGYTTDDSYGNCAACGAPRQPPSGERYYT